LCLPAIVKTATPEVTDRFQDGCRRHVGNSSECYKMGNYHPILMQIGTQTKKNMLNSKFTKCRKEIVGQISRWPPPPYWKLKSVQ
jgi:hypothetical protein